MGIYGLVEPRSRESFFLDGRHLNSLCFEKYLEEFPQKFPSDFHIRQLDNGKLHRKLELVIPENIILLFQPLYCPELNPIERFWKHLKKELKWINFNNLDELRDRLKKIFNSLSQEIVASVTGWQFIWDALFLAGI